MTQQQGGNKINRYAAWTNLQSRYLLEERGVPLPKTFSDVIVPIANADDALALAEVQEDTKSLTGTAGTYVNYFTVPAGEEWQVWMIHRAATIADSAIKTEIRQRVGTLLNTALSARDTAEAFEQYNDLRVFGGGETLGLENTGNAGDSAIALTIFYRRFFITQ